MQEAADYLSRVDPVLRPVIARAGLCTIVPHTNYYWGLVDGIISQQLSVKAAATIEGRFKNLFPEPFPLPEHILATPHEKLREAGLSNAKANYVRDLAQHIVDGTLKLDELDTLRDEEIIKKLTAVKGIGEWTAHMFLMFVMGRPNVLAVGDLGIKAGIQKLYNLKYLPTPEQVSEIAIKNKWSPCQTAACWYIWHAKDN